MSKTVECAAERCLENRGSTTDTKSRSSFWEKKKIIVQLDDACRSEFDRQGHVEY